MYTRLLAILALALVPAAAGAQVAAVEPVEAPAAVIAPADPVEAALDVPVVAAAPRAIAGAPSAGTTIVALADQGATPRAAQAPAAPVAPAPAPPATTPAPAARAERAAERAAAQEQRAEAARQRRIEAAQSKGVNVRIDATVIESRGEQVTGRKVLTITLVDGEWGSVRSSQQVPYRPKGSTAPVYNYRNAPLNMDARALLRDDGRIKVDLKLEYQSAAGDRRAEEGSEAPTATTPPAAYADAGTIDEGIRQSVGVVLESGKPLIVAQSADAVGDRRVALELKATVLK